MRLTLIILSTLLFLFACNSSDKNETSGKDKGTEETSKSDFPDNRNGYWYSDGENEYAGDRMQFNSEGSGKTQFYFEGNEAKMSFPLLWKDVRKEGVESLTGKTFDCTIGSTEGKAEVLSVKLLEEHKYGKDFDISGYFTSGDIKESFKVKGFLMD